ncbi:MAG: hypothetical protein LVQ75_03860 [Candidatus Babeliales bacterium]|jgi:hypothetical protein
MKLLLGLLFLGNSLLIAAMDKAQKADLQPPSFDTLFRIIAETQKKMQQSQLKTILLNNQTLKIQNNETTFEYFFIRLYCFTNSRISHFIERAC